jgi:hypothetical protein
MKQSVFIYSALAVIILGSVLFGLDWQPAISPPMKPIQVVALPPPPPPAPVVAPVAAPKVVTPNPSVPNPPVLSAPAMTAAPSPVAPVAQTPPKALCDVAACAAAYRSFRESDCTFNPSVGPRQLCTKGVVPKEATTAPAAPAPSDGQPASIMQYEPNARPNAQPSAQSNAKCNVSACAAAYHSFTESDCTFMATGGVRKVCTK